MTVSQPLTQTVTPSVPNVLANSVVVFSKNYLPMARINIRRAAVLLVSGRAEPMQISGDPGGEFVGRLRSPSLILDIPAQIRMRVGDSDRTWKPPSVSRREVLKRDGHACQYCGSKRKLTLDHVLPQSRGGRHTWDNVVTACEPCNQHKAARTPEEAKMPLAKKPKAPCHPVIAFAEQFWNQTDT